MKRINENTQKNWKHTGKNLIFSSGPKDGKDGTVVNQLSFRKLLESDLYTSGRKKKQNTAIGILSSYFMQTQLSDHTSRSLTRTHTHKVYADKLSLSQMFTQDVSEGKPVPFSFQAFHSHPLKTFVFA